MPQCRRRRRRCDRSELQIFQCKAGHAVCSVCRYKLKASGNGKCHVCGVATGGYTRCHAMEHLVESIRFPCPNAIHGCTVRCTYYDQHCHRQHACTRGVTAPARHVGLSALPLRPCSWTTSPRHTTGLAPPRSGLPPPPTLGTTRMTVNSMSTSVMVSTFSSLTVPLMMAAPITGRTCSC
ncbi:hypothetical protein SORBI_3009G047066 [Sorghum bicolor]|nr:hypothetical protein SORBI_3009G047066 [Sorghum bicolor]